MGIQVHPGCVNRQESGAEKISLRKLTLSVSLLTASLMLVAPAQAETWSCSPSSQIVNHIAVVFVSNGQTFERPITGSVLTYKSISLASNDDISYHDLVIGPPFFSQSPMAPTFETFV